MTGLDGTIAVPVDRHGVAGVASKIRSKSHVQVAVRDLTAILEIEEAPW